MKIKSFYQYCVKCFALGVVSMAVWSCATAPSVPPASYSAAPVESLQSAGVSAEMNQVAPAVDNISKSRSIRPESRPGLATTQGRKISSDISFVGFQRQDKWKPKGIASMYYNDQEGIDAMSSGSARFEGSGMQSAAGGLIEWGVRSGFRYSKNYSSKGKRFIVGKMGKEYSIVLKNKAHSRLELLVSVDGHNVISGKKASYSQRGYIVEAGETIVVKGFRTREDAVHAFKFSTVRNSFASQVHGDATNVGVIGVAVFTEKGVNPWKWAPTMVEQRLNAKAF